MTFPSLREFLRHLYGGSKKVRSVFSSEEEARKFCEDAYRKTGGVTPELRAAYEYYRQHYDERNEPGKP